MNVYKHIVFNPHLESIIAVIDRLGANPVWALSHVVPINEWAYVAVFEGWDGELTEKEAYGKFSVLNNETLTK